MYANDGYQENIHRIIFYFNYIQYIHIHIIQIQAYIYVIIIIIIIIIYSYRVLPLLPLYICAVYIISISSV